MYETTMTRHSTMIVGPTGGGKSVVVNAFVKTQTALGYPARTFTLNPKVGLGNSPSPLHFLFL